MCHSRSSRRGAAAVLVAVAALAGSGAAAAAPRVSTGMYGDRYCEILAVKGTLPNLVADVWNTYRLNDCPAAKWQAEDTAAITKDLGAIALRMNGPRFWLVDSASIAIAPGLGQLRTFGGLQMRKIAQVEVPIVNGAPGLAPYTSTTVRRANTFTWSRRHRVYELVAPDGTVWVMQAYSHIQDAKLTLAQLPGLGKRLKLPEGWAYRTRTLKRDLALTTTGKAKILQDELQDTYQFEHGG
jgi:hypothetical protein